MALTDIITKIKNDADTECARITEAAEAEVKKILTEAKERADDIVESGKESAQLLGKETHDRSMAAGVYQAKFATQGFHASLINRAFEEVEKRLAELPAKEYADFVEKRAQSLPEKEGTLTVTKERKDETLKALKAAGVDTKDVKEAPLLGGFILETRVAEYDHSLREVARQAREKYAGDAAHLLFN